MKRWLVMAIMVVACSGSDPEVHGWTGAVEAEVDNLTGLRTGKFRTFGPTQNLVAGADTIPVTVGYWCEIDESREPPQTADGMFFRISMPDTSLLVNDAAAFEELSGQLGLLDVARMAVDGRVYAWGYEPEAIQGGWYLDGHMRIEPEEELTIESGRGALLEQFRSSYADVLGILDNIQLYDVAEDQINRLTAIGADFRTTTWLPAQDYVASHYIGRDTIAIELKGVLAYPLDGFAAATDSARFWCPVEQSIQDWNILRAAYLAQIDSIHEAAVAALDAADQRRVAAREVAARARDARAREDETSRRERTFLLNHMDAFRISIFLEFAREHETSRLETEMDIRRICELWDTHRETAESPGRKIIMDALCRDITATGGIGPQRLVGASGVSVARAVGNPSPRPVAVSPGAATSAR